MKDEIKTCLECGGKACICSDVGCSDDATSETLWAAHCQDCNNTTGKRGCFDPIHNSESEAIEAWNVLNTGAFVY
jgi:hypothetical protein